jgi:hypothetical protein
MGDWILDRYREAIGTLFGWAATIVGTLIVAFCLGYWTGHGEITPALQSVGAFAQLFFIWLGFPQLIFAWVVTALVWYIPLHYPSPRLQIGMIAALFVIWSMVVHSMVAATENAKFFHY